MKRFLFSLLLVFILAASVSAQIEYIGFSLPENESRENSYQLNPYYFLHYLYTDVLEFFDLVDQLDLQTKIEIFEKIFNNLGEDYPAGLVIKFAGWDEPLRVSYRIFANESSRSILMTTNFNLEQEKTLKRHTLDCYARGYYIFGDKLVNLNYLFSEKKEEALLSDLNNLADFYIFDERVDNDHMIEVLLLAHINSDEPPVGKFIGYLTLAQYYMVINELDQAQKTLAEAEVLFANLEETYKENWGAPFAITKEELEILAHLRSTRSLAD